jgi:hypothetical protein
MLELHDLDGIGGAIVSARRGVKTRYNAHPVSHVRLPRAGADRGGIDDCACLELP